MPMAILCKARGPSVAKAKAKEEAAAAKAKAYYELGLGSVPLYCAPDDGRAIQDP